MENILPEAKSDSSIKDKSPESKALATVRWWENYLVRYFVGTAVGAAIILYFADPSLILLRNSVLRSGKETVDGGLNLITLTASAWPIVMEQVRPC
jgi:hypothetical protein